jgi:mannose-6-phosphate isomerase-like protein (cupin superfamily)
MRAFLAFSLLVSAPVALFGYSKESDSGLYFPSAKIGFVDEAHAGQHGMRTALLVAPDDVATPRHYSNSSMARVAVHQLDEGGGRRAHRPADFREQVFIVLAGAVEFVIGGETLRAAAEDVVVVPPEAERAFTAVGGPARMLQADWTHPDPSPGVTRPVLTSQRLRPLQPTHGEGYLTVGPNPRQEGGRLSIFSYGAAHIRARNSLLLYPSDLAGARPFTANTRVARMGLSEYAPDGGTRWHFHPDREQCFVILAGRAFAELGANALEVSAGDILFAPRHVGHAYKTMGAEPLRFFELEWGRE